ncbi:MAG: TniB family NTP-binding protein [Polyangiales bacterium]
MTSDTNGPDDVVASSAKPGERHDLTADALTILGRSAPERVQAIRSGTWIPYPRAKQALAQLRYVLSQPPSNRMMGLTLSGPTNNGKTTIVREFITANRAQPSDPSAERPEFLYVETPPVPNISMLYTQILRGVGDLKAEKGTMSQKLARVLHILPQLHPRMLFLDEIHNVLAGSARQSEAFLNTLKYLSNQLQLPVVLIGTEAALNVIRTDPQVLSRYPAFTLSPWAQDEQFARLVTVVLSTLPLRRPSKLSQANLARLHARSHGALGAVVQILQRAAVWAIETSTEEINARALEATEIG